MDEQRWIKKYANEWNERFKVYAGTYVGRLNVECMLKKFLKAYKQRENELLRKTKQT